MSAVFKEKSWFKSLVVLLTISSLMSDLSCLGLPDAFGETIPYSNTRYSSGFNAHQEALPEISPLQGHISEVFQGGDSRKIFIIQDLHSHTQAQKNIQSLVKTLIREEHVDLIALEGASGLLQRRFFEWLPAAPVISNILLENGVISGGEAAFLESDYDIPFLGVENREDYEKDLKIFLEATEQYSAFHQQIFLIRSFLNPLKSSLLNSGQQAFLEYGISYQEGRILLQEYLSFLTEISRGDDIQKFETIAAYLKLQDVEKKMDSAAVNAELDAWTRFLSRSLEEKTLKEFVRDMLLYRAGRRNLEDVLDAWCEPSLPSREMEKYPALLSYLEYLRKSHSLRLDRLMDETESLASHVEGMLFPDKISRHLINSERYLGQMEAMARLEMSRSQWDELLRSNNLSDIAESLFLHAVFTQTPVSVFFLLKLEMGMRTVAGFYRIAEEREVKMTENMLSKMRYMNADKGVLIVGGFHKDGVVSWLRSQNISYVVLIPNADIYKDYSKDQYLKALRGGKTPLENFFEGLFLSGRDQRNIIFPGINFYLSPHLKSSYALGKGYEESLQNLALGITVLLPFLKELDFADFVLKKKELKEALLDWAERKAVPLGDLAKAVYFLDNARLKGMIRFKKETYLWLDFSGSLKLVRVSSGIEQSQENDLSEGESVVLPASGNIPGFNEMPPEAFLQRILSLSTLWSKESIQSLIKKYGHAELLELFFNGNFRGFLKAIENGDLVDIRSYQSSDLKARLYRWMEGRKFWIAGLTLFYLAGYWTVNYITRLRGISLTLLNSWDLGIPFIPEFVFVYLLVIPLVFVPVVVIKKVKEFRLMIGAFLTNFAVTILHFLAIPFHVPRFKFNDSTFSERVLHLVQTIDLPYNSYPSFHVSLSFLAAFVLNRAHRLWGKAALFLSAGIAASTLFIKQHAILDVVSAFLLALLSYLVWFKWVPERFGKKWTWLKKGKDETFSKKDGVFSVDQEKFPYYARSYFKPKKGLAGLHLKRGRNYLFNFFKKLKDPLMADEKEFEKKITDFLDTYASAHDVRRRIQSSKEGSVWLKRFGDLSASERPEMERVLETLAAGRWPGTPSSRIRIKFHNRNSQLAYWIKRKSDTIFQWRLNMLATPVDALVDTVLGWAYQNPGSDPIQILTGIQEALQSIKYDKDELKPPLELLSDIFELAALEIELDLRRAQLWQSERKAAEDFLDFYGFGRPPTASPELTGKMSAWLERSGRGHSFIPINKLLNSIRQKKQNISNLFSSAVQTVYSGFKAHSDGTSRLKNKFSFFQTTRAKVAAWFMSLVLFIQVIMPLSILVTASCGTLSRSRMPFSGFDTRGFSEVYDLLRHDSDWNAWIVSLPSHHRQPYINDLTAAFLAVREYQSDSSDENFRRVQAALQHFADNPIVRHNPGMRANQLLFTLLHMDSGSARVLIENTNFLNLLSKSRETISAVNEIAKIIRRNGGYGDARNSFWRSFNFALLDQSDFRSNFASYAQEIIVLDAQGRLQFPFAGQGLTDLGLTQGSLSEAQLRHIFENESLSRLLAALNTMTGPVRSDALSSINLVQVSQSSTMARNLYQVSPYLSSDTSTSSFSGYGLSFWHSLLRTGLTRDQILNELLNNDSAVTFFIVFQHLTPELRGYLLTYFPMQDLSRLIVRVASNDPDGLAFLRLASRFSFNQSGELEVPYGIDVWKPILGDDVNAQNFLPRLKDLTTDYIRLEHIFSQLQGMGESNAAAILGSTRGRSIFTDDTVRARYVLGFGVRWRGSAAGLREVAPIIWDNAQSPDYSNALDTLSFLRIEDPALARNYFRIIQDIDATTNAALKERRTRDFQVALHLLSEFYRRRLLPWADSQDLFRALLETPLAANVSDYPYQSWLENRVVRRLRTTLTDWEAPMPPAFFVSSDPAPTTWSQVPWQDVLIRAWVGIYFQEQGRLYPSSGVRIRNIHGILNRFHADSGNASSFLLNLSYAMELEIFPSTVRERFPANFPSRHEFTGRGDTWSNGHFYSSSFSISGHMSALRSEISHAFQERAVEDEQERATQQGWRYEYGILSGEFEDRALGSALQRDIPYLIHQEAGEYVYLKMELLREVLDHSQNRLLVIPLLSGIVNEEQVWGLERSIRLGERASDILERLSPSQRYYLGDRLYQNGLRVFTSPSRTRLLRIDQSLLDAGIDRNDFQDQINNAVGIVALQTHGFSGLYDARLRPYEAYQEASSSDHEFSERLAADLVVQVLYMSYQESLSAVSRPYVMARAVRHIYRISNKTGKSERVPLRLLIESINQTDVHQWVRDLEQDGQLENSSTQRPRGPLEPTEDTYRLRRSTPERRQRDELGWNDVPSRRPSGLWMSTLAFGLVLSIGVRRKKQVKTDKMKQISESGDLNQVIKLLKSEKLSPSDKRRQRMVNSLLKNPHLTQAWIQKLMASHAVSIDEMKRLLLKASKEPSPLAAGIESMSSGRKDIYFQTAA